ncbi:SRPBCC family protein [Nocardioides sp. URHA0032]|uniref:SRPBCC family protein n=1 Tax=Nocardioides sp. URHA0032 TaxID=1380388 RepID=UPI00048A8615|nr:SRPBCC family protein [Nocardioides sp. URHA0032]
MSTNTRLIHATPEQVWDVLSDGWLYPLWVVGATRMRDVDDRWPEVGSRLHHSVGTWPLVIDDSTEVVESVPGLRLVIHAKAWPTGTAGVTIRLEAVGTETEVTIEEDAARGPVRLIPKPLRDLPLKWRNTESLRRLAYIAERRSAGSTSLA